MSHVWGYRLRKNLRSAAHLFRVRDALVVGPVFGYWYRAHSGGGPTNWLVTDFDSYLAMLGEARPADYYVAWSLAQLLERGAALAAARYDDLPAGATSLFSPDDLSAVEAWLDHAPRDPMREVFTVFIGAAPGPEALVEDEVSEVAENAEWYCQPGGAGYAFPFTASQTRDADGLLSNTIERPEYWLLDGWYPDDLGRVPTEIEYG